MPIALRKSVSIWSFSKRSCGHIGQDLNKQAKEVWAHGRVLVVDGSGFSMPDTESNAGKFIRHGENTPGKANKKSGVAFPIGRIVALFSLATGALVDMTVSTWKGKGTGEISLLYSKKVPNSAFRA